MRILFSKELLLVCKEVFLLFSHPTSCWFIIFSHLVFLFASLLRYNSYKFFVVLLTNMSLQLAPWHTLKWSIFLNIVFIQYSCFVFYCIFLNIVFFLVLLFVTTWIGALNILYDLYAKFQSSVLKSWYVWGQNRRKSEQNVFWFTVL